MFFLTSANRVVCFPIQFTVTSATTDAALAPALAAPAAPPTVLVVNTTRVQTLVGGPVVVDHHSMAVQTEK
jgi:hypothetical protein